MKIDRLRHAVTSIEDLVSDGTSPNVAAKLAAERLSLRRGEATIVCQSWNTGLHEHMRAGETDVPELIDCDKIAACRPSSQQGPPPGQYIKVPRHKYADSHWSGELRPPTEERLPVVDRDKLAAAAETAERRVQAGLLDLCRQVNHDDRTIRSQLFGACRERLLKVAVATDDIDLEAYVTRLAQPGGHPDTIGRLTEAEQAVIASIKSAAALRQAAREAVDKYAAMVCDGGPRSLEDLPVKTAASPWLPFALGNVVSRPVEAAHIAGYMSLMDDPRHQQLIDSIRARTVVQSMLATDPQIKAYSPAEVLDAYNSISLAAPRIARNPVMLQAAIKRHLSQGGMSLDDINTNLIKPDAELAKVDRLGDPLMLRPVGRRLSSSESLASDLMSNATSMLGQDSRSKDRSDRSDRNEQDN